MTTRWENMYGSEKDFKYNVFAPGVTLQTRGKSFTQIRKNSWTFWEFLQELSYL